MASKRRVRSKGGCESGKVRYRSKDEAVYSLHRIKGGSQGYSPVRSYACGKCHGWHLTSSEQAFQIKIGDWFEDGGGI